jgi:hypothetical protein
MNTLGTAPNVTNMNTLAGISGDITNVSGISANVTTVAGVSANVTTVAGVAANVTTVAGSIASVNTNATNIVAIQGAAANAATATTQAGIATTKAGEASASAATATTKADESSASASASEAAKDAALAALDSFDDRYLGSKASDPTLDNDGNALVAGALYFNTTDNVMKVYTGSAWVAAYASLSGALLVANNLSDLASNSSARTNLGLATVAATGAYGDLSGTPAAALPLAGGTLTGNVNLGDNVKANFGAGSDLQIYHNGSNSYIDEVGTGNLRIRAIDLEIMKAGTGEYMIKGVADGAVTLYHDNAAKIATTATGISVTGNATFADNDKAIFGAGSDLQIYHNGSTSVIEDSGTGALQIKATDLEIRSYTTNENYIYCVENGAVTLYYNDAAKIATSATGVTVTGTVAATAYTGDGSGLTGVGASTTYNAVGTYAFLYFYGTGVAHNVTKAGSVLNPAGNVIAVAIGANYFADANLSRGSTTMSGTWRSMGWAGEPGGSATRITLWVRIS